MARCPFAKWIGSPNFWPGRLPLESLVDHIAQGTLAGTDGWFNNPNSQASAHFEVGKAGEIHQYVDTDNSAWGNGALLKPDLAVHWIAEAFASKTVAEYWSRHPNRRTISIEHEGQTGEAWTTAMYAADLRLKKWLLETHEFGRHLDGFLLLGHHHFDSVNRSRCPGTGWPKDRLKADLLALEEEDMPLTTNELSNALVALLETPDDKYVGAKRALKTLAKAVVDQEVLEHALTPHGGTLPALKVHIPGQTVTVPPADIDVVLK